MNIACSGWPKGLFGMSALTRHSLTFSACLGCEHADDFLLKSYLMRRTRLLGTLARGVLLSTCTAFTGGPI